MGVDSEDRSQKENQPPTDDRPSSSLGPAAASSTGATASQAIVADPLTSPQPAVSNSQGSTPAETAKVKPSRHHKLTAKLLTALCVFDKTLMPVDEGHLHVSPS